MLADFSSQVCNHYVTHPETSSRGLIPEMIQVCELYILIVLIELNALIYVRPLNEWQILELGHFEVGNFGKIFSHNWGVLEQLSRAQTKA